MKVIVLIFIVFSALSCDRTAIVRGLGSSTTHEVGGTVWHSGLGAPSVILGDVGDFYLNSSNGDVYKKVDSPIVPSWSFQLNIRGATGIPGGVGPAGPAGVNGTDGLNGMAGPKALIFVNTVPPPSVACGTATGQQIVTCTDSDDNGMCNGPEVITTKYVCNGSNGSKALVFVSSEPPGGGCGPGLAGQKMTSCQDINGNNMCDPIEAPTTSYVCNGAQGAAGVNGAAGADGTVWYDGPAVPGPGFGNSGDYFLLQSTKRVWRKNSAGNWVDQGFNLTNALPTPLPTSRFLRLTRTLLDTYELDSVKDSQCDFEFGSDYQTATAVDLLFTLSADGHRSTGTGRSFIQTNNGILSFAVATVSGEHGSFQVACIRKDAPLRATRVDVLSDSMVKDNECINHVGINYRAATAQDLSLDIKIATRDAPPASPVLLYFVVDDFIRKSFSMLKPPSVEITSSTIVGSAPLVCLHI